MEKHVRILAVLSIVLGVLGVLAGLLLLGLLGGIAGLVASGIHVDTGEVPPQAVAPILRIVGAVLFVVLAATSVPGIVAGIGLLHYRPWARILGIVLAAISLPGVPFGTALGIYGLWVLLNVRTQDLFNS